MARFLDVANPVSECGPRLTVVDGIAGLGAVTEEAVVAVAVVRGVDDDVVDLVAAVVGTPDLVIDHRGVSSLPVVDGLAARGLLLFALGLSQRKVGKRIMPIPVASRVRLPPAVISPSRKIRCRRRSA